MAEYGRSELTKVLRRNHVLGLIISIIIHGLAISSWYGVQRMSEEEASASSVGVRILRYSDLGPPPSIAARAAMPALGFAIIAKPDFGTPIPVPDLHVNPAQTFATQEELSGVPSLVGEDVGKNGNGLQVAEDITPVDKSDADDPGIDEVVPVDKSPEMVLIVLPRYPEMAIRAGIEGNVWAKLLVGKDGKVLKAVIVKSESEIFNDVTTEAAMKFIFAPAYTHAGPVKAWIEIPFRFRLKDASLAEKR